MFRTVVSIPMTGSTAYEIRFNDWQWCYPYVDTSHGQV